MSKDEIKEKILLEKNANLIDTFEFANNCYAKVLVNSNDSGFELDFKYYKIYENKILDLNDDELEEVKNFFETNLGNIVY